MRGAASHFGSVGVVGSPGTERRFILLWQGPFLPLRTSILCQKMPNIDLNPYITNILSSYIVKLWHLSHLHASCAFVRRAADTFMHPFHLPSTPILSSPSFKYSILSFLLSSLSYIYCHYHLAICYRIASLLSPYSPPSFIASFPFLYS